MSTRREFLALSSALALTPIAAPLAFAETGRTQVAGFYRRGVGDATVTAVLDGFLQLDPNMLTGVKAEDIPALLAKSFLTVGPIDTSVNAYVIETGGKTILVDGGAASAFGPTAGKTAAGLEAAGVKPEDVDLVFATHLHPDHIGAFTDEGEARFPNAQLALHETELGFWTTDANFASAADQAKGFAKAAQIAVSAYADRLAPVKDGADIAPGVRAMHLPGHTPGHTGLMISSGAQSMLLWADIVHLGPLQFTQPKLTIPFDVDQPLAAKTRAKALDMVSKDRLEIAGSHIDFPSFGHVEAASEGYRFVSSRWDHQL